MNHITSMTASELSDLLKEKEISSLELTEAFLHQIEQKDPIISAFLSVCDDIARDSARLIDERRIKGEQLPALAGIPMALKDNICKSFLILEANASISSKKPNSNVISASSITNKEAFSILNV